MLKPNSTDAAGILMALTQGVATWHAVVPDLKRVNAATVDDEQFFNEFRRAEVTAGGITLGVGVLGSFFLKAVYPFLAALLIVALLVVVYEVSIRSAPPNQ